MERVFTGTEISLPYDEFVGKVTSIDKEGNCAILENPLYDGKVCVHSGETMTEFHHQVQIKQRTLPEFRTGDVVRVNKAGRVEIHHSEGRNDNALFITENCNCNCVSCPQPPVKRRDFDYFFWINQQIIECLDDSCESIGITGGEPLLAEKYFFHTLQLLNDKLPNANVQVLTNGILLGSERYFESLKELVDKRYLFGVPLYSDFPDDHDRMVNFKGGFYRTMNGLYNLATTEAKIEIRVLLNATTVGRLKQLSSYIYKNLPFVSHVAFMGLEGIGNALHNWNQLTVDYSKTMQELEENVEFLSNWNIPVSIYNVPLCNLSPSLWPFVANSISDWKRHYSDECNQCLVKENCGGVFSTSAKSNVKVEPVLELTPVHSREG